MSSESATTPTRAARVRRLTGCLLEGGWGLLEGACVAAEGWVGAEGGRGRLSCSGTTPTRAARMIFWLLWVVLSPLWVALPVLCLSGGQVVAAGRASLPPALDPSPPRACCVCRGGAHGVARGWLLPGCPLLPRPVPRLGRAEPGAHLFRPPQGVLGDSRKTRSCGGVQLRGTKVCWCADTQPHHAISQPCPSTPSHSVPAPLAPEAQTSHRRPPICSLLGLGTGAPT